MSGGARVTSSTPGAVKAELPTSKPGKKPRTRWYKTQADADRAIANATRRSQKGHQHSPAGRQRAIHKILVSQLLDQQGFACHFCKRLLQYGYVLSDKRVENQPNRAILVCRVCHRKATARRTANRPRSALG